jgi:hypothetical protein
VSVASEYDHAEQVVADVAILQDMAEGRLDDERVKEAAQVLLEHKRHELPSVSVAVAARLLGVSRTIIESWREAGVLTSVPVRRRRYEISIESIVRVQALLEELRRLGIVASVLGPVRDDDHPLVVSGQWPPVLAEAGHRAESRGKQPVP